MESKGKLKEIDIKNHTCYFFYDLMRLWAISFSDILSEKKLYENILIYDISYKTFMGTKSLRIWFDKIDGFIKFYEHY